MNGTSRNWTNATEANTSSPDQLIYSSNFVFFCAIVYVVLVGCGVLLNLLVMYVMLRSRKIRRSISSFLIFHLSLTHVIFHATFPWLSINHSNDSPLACKITVLIELSCAAAIFSSLAAIAWDRARNIMQPFKSLAPRRLKTYLLLIAGIWLYAFVTSSPFIYSVRSKSEETCWEQGNGTKKCRNYTFCRTSPDWTTQLTGSLCLMMAFLVPFTYILATYTKIALILWRRSKSGNIHGAVAKNKARTIRLMVIAVFVFSVCWGTNFVVGLLEVYGALDNLSFESDIMLVALCYIAQALSSCLNPVVYAFFSPEFRKNCVQFCCCCFPWCLYFCRGCRGKRKVQPIPLGHTH